jgi:DNA ligase-1
VKRFAQLFAELDRTTKTSRKTDALARYFREAPPEDCAWAFFFLSGRRLKRLLPAARLASFAVERAQISPWLFGECANATGDFAEAAALVLPPPSSSAQPPSLAKLVRERVLPLRELDEAKQRALITTTWDELTADERFVWNKILTGAFRVGVSELLVLRGISAASGVDAGVLKHRSMGALQNEYTDPTSSWWTSLVAKEGASAAHDANRPERPYPFCLAHPLDFAIEELGDVDDWQVEWKWDGIRGQLVRRANIALWSRGEELVTQQFPEIIDAAAKLPKGTVVDGEVLPWKEHVPSGGVLAFSELQRRLNRKKLTPALLGEVPIAFLTYDLLEHGGVDVRARPLSERRALLERIVADAADERIKLSEIVRASSWADFAEVRKQSRARSVEGFMLKRRSSHYGVGRKRGEWWKWKIDPYAVDAVLVYAQHGSGKRASLYTDYTFAVWNEAKELVTFAKAYSGLTDDEIKEVDGFVRRNTIEKFGPVHRVKPELVFEIGFEGIARSTRHKSGVAVRFPRMLRWRKDKPANEADTIETLRALLTAAGA